MANPHGMIMLLSGIIRITRTSQRIEVCASMHKQIMSLFEMCFFNLAILAGMSKLSTSLLTNQF